VPFALYANKADSLVGGITETDPIFNSSVAKGITSSDTTYWNNKLDSYTEIDPIFNSSVAKGITTADTAAWNNHLSADLDTDTTNELQTISLVNDTIWLSNAGGNIPMTVIKSYLDSLNGYKSPITKYLGQYSDSGTNVSITINCSSSSTEPGILNTRYLDTFSLKAGDFLQIKGARVCTPNNQSTYCYQESSKVSLEDSAGNQVSGSGAIQAGYSGCNTTTDVIYIIPNDGDYILVSRSQYRTPLRPAGFGLRSAYIFIN